MVRCRFLALLLIGLLAVIAAACASTSVLTEPQLTAVAEAPTPAPASVDVEEARPEPTAAPSDLQPEPTPEELSQDLPPQPEPPTNSAVAELSSEDAAAVELLEFAFELGAGVVAGRAPEPVDAVDLVNPVLVEGIGFDGFSFGTNDLTEILMIPTDGGTAPAAVAMVLDPESITSFQTALTTSIWLEESELSTRIAFNLTFELGPTEAVLEGTSHTATITKVETGRRGYEWVLTFVPYGAALTDGALREAVLGSAESRWATLPEAPTIERQGGAAVSASHIPLELGTIDFGMTIDEFATETGDDLSSAETRSDRTTISQDFADGDIEGATFFFRTPDDLLYEVVVRYRLEPADVAELALEMFGPEDPNMPDIRARAKDILIFGDTDQDWLLPTPDGLEAWAKRTDDRIVIVSTMPDTEMGFVAAPTQADDGVADGIPVLTARIPIPAGTSIDEILESPLRYLFAKAVPPEDIASASVVTTLAGLQAFKGYVTGSELEVGEQLRSSTFEVAPA